MTEWNGSAHRPRPWVLNDFRPGHVFWLSAGTTWLNLDKQRPFVLATACGTRHEPGTLVYGSTQATERQFGAACLEVDPVRAGLNRNGLSRRTFFYPGALLVTTSAHLPPHAGFLGRSVEQLRSVLRAALGIGQGSCLTAGAPTGSRRGRIVLLQPNLALHVRTSFAVLLTELRYSCHRHHHIILPILPASGTQGAADELVLTSGDWLSVFSKPPQRVLLPVPVVQSVWYDDDVARETEHVMDEESLARIDRALCDYFSLPDPPPVG